MLVLAIKLQAVSCLPHYQCNSYLVYIAMGKNGLPSLKFLIRRRNKAIDKNVSPSKSPKRADRKSSGSSSITSTDDVAFFHSDQPDKVKVTPIPTAPPSPPKGKLKAASMVSQSMPDLDICSAPPSPKSPTSLSPPAVRLTPSPPPAIRLTPSPPAVRPTPSPPGSPKNEAMTAEASGESTLDRGVRLSAFIPDNKRHSAEITESKRLSAELNQAMRLSPELAEAAKRLSLEPAETKRLSAEVPVPAQRRFTEVPIPAPRRPIEKPVPAQRRSVEIVKRLSAESKRLSSDPPTENKRLSAGRVSPTNAAASKTEQSKSGKCKYEEGKGGRVHWHKQLQTQVNY